MLQEFNITIVGRLGKSSVVAYFLSILNNPSQVTPVNDDFPDEHLFAMSTDSPWFTGIANYLVTGKMKSGVLFRKVLHIPGFKEISFTLVQI